VNCRELTQALTDRREGRLAPAALAALDAHLALCPDCRCYVDKFERTITTVGDIANAPPEPAPDALIRAVLDARRRGG
jgi:predicted anti-sigma-YlaC factor YlaD